MLESGEIVRSELAFVDLAGSERGSNLVEIQMSNKLNNFEYFEKDLFIL